MSDIDWEYQEKNQQYQENKNIENTKPIKLSPTATALRSINLILNFSQFLNHLSSSHTQLTADEIVTLLDRCPANTERIAYWK